MELLKAALKNLVPDDWRSNHLTIAQKAKYASMVDSLCDSSLPIEDIFISLSAFLPPGDRLKSCYHIYLAFLTYGNFTDAEKEKLAAIAIVNGSQPKENLAILMAELN